MKNILSNLFILKSPTGGFRGLLFRGLLLFLLLLFSCAEEEVPPTGSNRITFGNTTYSAVSYTTATVSTSVGSANGNKIVQHGVCWTTGTNPTIEDSKKIFPAAWKTCSRQLLITSGHTSPHHLKPFTVPKLILPRLKPESLK